MKALNWSEPAKATDGVSSYDHTILETPLGRAIIEWKSWKDDPDYGLMIGDAWICSGYDLDEVKQKACEYLEGKLKDLEILLKGV